MEETEVLQVSVLLHEVLHLAPPCKHGSSKQFRTASFSKPQFHSGWTRNIIWSPNKNSLTHGAEPFSRSRQLRSHSKTSQRFMEPESSLPRSQEPVTGPYPESNRSNPYHPILSKINFNIVQPSMSRSSQWFLSSWISHQYPICIPLRPHSCYMPCPSHPPWLDHSNHTWRIVF
jgi:hypothetical protein